MAKRQCNWPTPSGKCPNKCGHHLVKNPDGTTTRTYNIFCGKHQKLHDSMTVLVVDLNDSEQDREFPAEFLQESFGRGLISYRPYHYFLPSSFTKVEKERRLNLLTGLYQNFLRDYMK